jgi:integrase
MDARTRERLPVLPMLVAAADRHRKDAATRLVVARATAPGEMFTAAGQELRRACLAHPSPRTWAEEPGSGERRDLTREEDHAFWAWAIIEVLRHTGIRVEELTELSHHSLVGASVKCVQLALGHATPTITLNTYVGEWPDTDQETSTIMDAALGQVPRMCPPAGRLG